MPKESLDFVFYFHKFCWWTIMLEENAHVPLLSGELHCNDKAWKKSWKKRMDSNSNCHGSKLETRLNWKRNKKKREILRKRVYIINKRDKNYKDTLKTSVELESFINDYSTCLYGYWHGWTHACLPPHSHVWSRFSTLHSCQHVISWSCISLCEVTTSLNIMCGAYTIYEVMHQYYV